MLYDLYVSSVNEAFYIAPSPIKPEATSTPSLAQVPLIGTLIPTSTAFRVVKKPPVLSIAPLSVRKDSFSNI